MASAASQHQRALALYRQLLRSQRVTFANDLPMQQQARTAIRSYYNQFRALSDSTTIEAQLVAAEEAVEYLRTKVIQAKRTGAEGQFTAVLRPEHAVKDPMAQH